MRMIGSDPTGPTINYVRSSDANKSSAKGIAAGIAATAIPGGIIGGNIISKNTNKLKDTEGKLNSTREALNQADAQKLAHQKALEKLQNMSTSDHGKVAFHGVKDEVMNHIRNNPKAAAAIAAGAGLAGLGIAAKKMMAVRKK